MNLYPTSTPIDADALQQLINKTPSSVARGIFLDLLMTIRLPDGYELAPSYVQCNMAGAIVMTSYGYITYVLRKKTRFIIAQFTIDDNTAAINVSRFNYWGEDDPSFTLELADPSSINTLELWVNSICELDRIKQQAIRRNWILCVIVALLTPIMAWILWLI